MPTSNNPFLQEQKKETLEPIDEDDPSVKNSQLLQSIIRHKKIAKQYDLNELFDLLDELLPALAGSSRKHINIAQNLYTVATKLSAENMTKLQLDISFKKYLDELNKKFEFDDDSEYHSNLTLLLGPDGIFDMMHKGYAAQEVMILGMQKNTKDILDIERDFERTNPLEKLRSKELGYTTMTKKNIDNAETADELAKKAFAMKRFWTAEYFWNKALEFDPSNVKYYSNLSCVLKILGRYLRSLTVGYGKIAQDYLEKAVRTAEEGIKLDPTWERSFQQGAEAYFAMHSHEYSMKILNLLKPAFDHVEEPSQKIHALRDKAKLHASQWFKLFRTDGNHTIPKYILNAIFVVKIEVSKACAMCYNSKRSHPPTAQELEQAGDDIYFSLMLTLAALQRMYTKRAQYHKEEKAQKCVPMHYQIHLRQIAKTMPLDVLSHSQKLLDLILMEKPNMFWGLECLDRLNLDYLGFKASDPTENDKSEHNGFNELLARATGSCDMDMESIRNVMEMTSGKDADSKDPDMAMHHLCAFTMTILDRLVSSTKYPELIGLAIKKVLLYNSNYVAMIKGGEFIGKVTKGAMGLDAFKRDGDATQFFRFIDNKGALKAVATECYQSSDPGQWMQKLMCLISPFQWATFDLGDCVYVLYQYGLDTIDGKHLGLKLHDEKDDSTDPIDTYVATIVGNIIQGYFDYMPRVDESGEPSKESILIMGCFQKSAFGNFLFSDSLSWDAKEISSYKDIVMKGLAKWKKASKNKKAAHRWNAMDEEEQDSLKHLKPLSKVELFEKRLNEEQSKKDSHTITAVPECASCGDRAVQHKCPCKLVYYCSKECQSTDWKTHKAIQKKAMKNISVK